MDFNRRSFMERSVALGTLSLTAAGLCVCALAGCVKQDRTPVIESRWLEVSASEIRVQVKNVPALQRPGAAKVVHERLPEPIIVIRASDEARFIACSGNCTHRGRPLEYASAVQELRCINFGHSTFALDGIPKKGPAKRSLRLYKTLYLNGVLEVFL